MNYSVQINQLIVLLMAFLVPGSLFSTGAEPGNALSGDPSHCTTFSESERGDDAKNAYVIYRGFMKSDELKKAKPYWEKVYRWAPGADGQRWTVYSDGIKIYRNLLKKAEDSAKVTEYKEKIFDFYDQIVLCYPAQEGYIAGRKAYDLYYRYPDWKPDSVKFALFEKAIDIQGENTPAFVMNPFTNLLIRRYSNDKIDREEAIDNVELIRTILEQKESEETLDDSWKPVMEYVPRRLAKLESVKGFYNYQYYLEKYYPLYAKNPDSCKIVKKVYSKLNWANTPEDDSLYQAVESTINNQCKFEISGSDLEQSAYKSMRDGQYTDAVKQFKKAVVETEKAEKKARYNMVLGQIHYAHLKDFPTARRYALKAADQRPEWGNPYILIGKLYASSGPICGPGKGWDSQVVVWIAIDTWKKAKRIDPSVASDANRLIASYAQYMPTKEDIFSRMHEIGDSYKVGCWIQRTTTVRPASDS